MNLEENLQKSSTSFIDGRVVALSVLLGGWSRLKDKKDSINCCVVLLQLLRDLTSDQEQHRSETNVHAVQSYSAVLVAVEQRAGKAVANALDNKCRAVAGDLRSFMDVFDHLSTLLRGQGAGSKAPVGGVCQVCVFGYFIQRCRVEYRRLTFTQVVSASKAFAAYIDQKDCSPPGSKPRPRSSAAGPSSAVESALLRGGQRGCYNLQSSIQSLLALVEEYSCRGYQQEAELGLQECIKLSLEENQPELIRETLSWVVELYSGGEDSPSMEGHLNLLATGQEGEGEESGGGASSHSAHFLLWSRLKLCKELSLRGESQERLAQSVVKALHAAFKPGVSDGMKMAATYLVARCWDHLGYRTVGQMYCALTCHMVSDQGGEPRSLASGHAHSVDTASESIAHCLASMSQYLFDKGCLDEGRGLVRAAEEEFPEDSMGRQVLSRQRLCMELEWLCRTEATQRSRAAVEELRLHHPHLAFYWTCVVMLHEGLFADLVSRVQAALTRREWSSRTGKKMAARLRLLLAEALLTSDPSRCLEEASRVVQECSGYGWTEIVVKGKTLLATALLGLGSPGKCCDLVTKECLLHQLTSGDLLTASQSWLLLAQGAYMLHCSNPAEAVSRALPHLNEAVLGFRKSQSRPHLRKSLLLLLNFYQLLGNTRDVQLVVKELEQLV